MSKTVTKKAATKKASKKTAPKKAAKKSTEKEAPEVKLSVNQYDIEMLEIPKEGNKRPLFISLNKALAILDANGDETLMEVGEKYDKRMYKIKYNLPEKNTGSFWVSPEKFEFVVKNDDNILNALAKYSNEYELDVAEEA